jgi:hypothetical protein
VIYVQGLFIVSVVDMRMVNLLTEQESNDIVRTIGQHLFWHKK